MEEKIHDMHSSLVKFENAEERKKTRHSTPRDTHPRSSEGKFTLDTSKYAAV